MSIPFIKMHGLGNDFAIFDGRRQPIAFDGKQAAAIAAQRTGIGCDQVIVMEPSQKADLFMRIFNADGGEVASCGNATRCVAWLFMEESGKDACMVETKAGLLACQRAGDRLVRVDMGPPRFNWREIPLTEEADTQHLHITLGALAHPAAVSMGNPHMVFAVENVEAIDLDDVGPRLEQHPLFPERVNVSIAQALDRHRIRLRVWERGAGRTQACGTAACAALAVLHQRGLVDAAAQVELPGGTLEITWDKKTSHIWMAGAVAESFRGEWRYDG